jgi:hypothetical protein
VIDARLQPHLASGLVTLAPLVEEDWASIYAVSSDPLIWAGHPARDRCASRCSAASSRPHLPAAGRWRSATWQRARFVARRAMTCGGREQLGRDRLDIPSARPLGRADQCRDQAANDRPRVWLFLAGHLPSQRRQSPFAPGDGENRRSSDRSDRGATIGRSGTSPCRVRDRS